MSLEKNISMLSKYKFLKKNWNGNQADPFDKNFLDFLIKLLPELEIQPKIFPTARDSIQFEYEINFENYPNTYLEIEIWKNSFDIFIQNDEKQVEKEICVDEIITSSIINEIVNGNYKGGFFLD